MKMKKTDVGVVIFMYLVCALFLYMSQSLSETSKTYPMFTIWLLFGLTTLYLVTMFVNAGKYGVESGVKELFDGFKPAQLLFCIALTVVYMLMVKYIGFFVATIVFMFAVLHFLRVPMVASLISVAVINLLVYFAFVKFLGVRLPAGLLF